MPNKVIFSKKGEATAYAKEMDGDVMENPNGDGFVVVPKPMDIGEAFDDGTFRPPENRNMGGMMDDEMGYMDGGMHGGPKKMFKGGAAIKGRGFKGIH
tara:strand:- start:54 stop:347 length:294 start_codon:yes stop_codon:yes gene_type:complete